MFKNYGRQLRVLGRAALEQLRARRARETPTQLERAIDRFNKRIMAKLGVPNTVQIAHAPLTQPQACGNDRAALGRPLPWLPLHAAPGMLARLPGRGSIIEICSPGRQCRGVAAQMATKEARSDPVLWIAVGPSPCSLELGGPLEELPNLTRLQLPISTAAHSKAALEQLLAAVRSQRFSLVVLDCVPALAPPPPGAWPRPGARSASHSQAAGGAAGAAATATALEPAATTAAATAAPAAPAAAVAAAAAAAAAAPHVAAKGDAAGVGIDAPPAVRAATAPERGGEASCVSAWWQTPAATGAARAAAALERARATAQGQSALSAAAGRQHPGEQHYCGAGRDSGESRGAAAAGPPANLKFLHNLLPVLLEATLADLAASCGPGLRTTTLLLNSYSWQGRPEEQGGQGWLVDTSPGGGEGSSSSSYCRGGYGSSSGDSSYGGGGWSGIAAGRSRWARRAIVRHAAASLHVLPAAGPGGGGGACGSEGPLLAVLTLGSPSGEDGDAVFRGPLRSPVGPAEPHQ